MKISEVKENLGKDAEHYYFRNINTGEASQGYLNLSLCIKDNIISIIASEQLIDNGYNSFMLEVWSKMPAPRGDNMMKIGIVEAAKMLVKNE